MTGVPRQLNRWLFLPGLCCVLAAFTLGASIATPAHAKASPPQVAYRQITVARVVALPAGRATRTFGFSIRGDYADLVVLDVPAGAAVSVRALPANGMQIVGTSTRARSGVCRRHDSRVVCTQGLEWCGLVQGVWRATVRKTSTAAAVVRVRLVFVRRIANGVGSAL